MPELVAIRAIRVVEQIDNSGGILAAIGDPGAAFHARPHLLGHRLIHQSVQRRACQVLALGIEQGADQDVLAIGREVEGKSLAVVARGIATQPTRCRELAHDGGSARLNRLDGCGQLLGLRNRNKQ
ncbi:hypothetical protein FQZ97_843790 [compost metagenome]